MTLKQGEWNRVRLGHDKFKNKCKRVHIKDISVETKVEDFIPVIYFQYWHYIGIIEIDHY